MLCALSAIYMKNQGTLFPYYKHVAVVLWKLAV